MIWIELAGFAVLAAGLVRVALIVWPPPAAKLPASRRRCRHADGGPGLAEGGACRDQSKERPETMGIFSREKIIGGGKPSGFYAGCYRDPETGARGPEIWLPWLDPVLIVGRNRVGKDTGIIVPNALMGDGDISQVFQDTRLEVAAIAARYCRKQRRTWVANAFGELVDEYPDLKSNRVNLLKARELDPDHPLCFEHLCELTEAIIPRGENEHNPFFPLGAQALWAACNKGELKAAKDEGRDPSLLNVRMQATEAEQFDPATREPVTGVRAYARRVIDAGDDPQSASMLGPFAGQQSDGLRDVVATARRAYPLVPVAGDHR